MTKIAWAQIDPVVGAPLTPNKQTTKTKIASGFSIAKYDVFHESISGSDPGVGDLMVELTYTQESNSIFHHYSDTLEVRVRLVDSVRFFWRNWVDNTTQCILYFHLQKDQTNSLSSLTRA